MPRKPRVEYAGACYHVMSRGDHGCAIVKDDKDRDRFVKTLSDVCGRTGWLIHAYVLMDNHYHLLVQTPEANLVTGMKWLQGTFTIRSNFRYHEHGHLFQGRYKALVMDSTEDGYMRRVSTYIHLNPARAGLLEGKTGGLCSYRWSSYPLYLAAPGSRPAWLTTGRVLVSLGVDPTGLLARHQYEAYMENCVEQWATESGRQMLAEAWKDIRRGWCLGDAGFRDMVLERIEQVIKGRMPNSYSGEAVQRHDEVAAERTLQEALALFGLSESALSGMRKGADIKRVLVWALRKRTTVSNRWLSVRLGIGHPANVPGYLRSVERAIAGSLFQLRCQIEKILISED